MEFRQEGEGRFIARTPEGYIYRVTHDGRGREKLEIFNIRQRSVHPVVKVRATTQKSLFRWANAFDANPYQGWHGGTRADRAQALANSLRPQKMQEYLGVEQVVA